MEDGPEVLGGTYVYGGRSYRLREIESEEWSVFDGETLLGVVKATTGPERGPFYVARLAEETEFRSELSDDWEGLIEFVIDAESNPL